MALVLAHLQHHGMLLASISLRIPAAAVVVVPLRPMLHPNASRRPTVGARTNASAVPTRARHQRRHKSVRAVCTVASRVPRRRIHMPHAHQSYNRTLGAAQVCAHNLHIRHRCLHGGRRRSRNKPQRLATTCILASCLKPALPAYDPPLPCIGYYHSCSITDTNIVPEYWTEDRIPYPSLSYP